MIGIERLARRPNRKRFRSRHECSSHQSLGFFLFALWISKLNKYRLVMNSARACVCVLSRFYSVEEEKRSEEDGFWKMIALGRKMSRLKFNSSFWLVASLMFSFIWEIITKFEFDIQLLSLNKKVIKHREWVNYIHESKFKFLYAISKHPIQRKEIKRFVGSLSLSLFFLLLLIVIKNFNTFCL